LGDKRLSESGPMSDPVTYTYLGRTVEEWRRLGQMKLSAQRQLAINFSRYYDGEPVGLMLEGRSRDVFRRLMRESRANWCELIVNAVAERLRVVGFRFNDQSTDDTAWYCWQANAMDADSEMVQTDALVCGHSFVSVWPDDNVPSGVRINAEHPAEVCCFYMPPDRRTPIAAYKLFLDPWAKQVEICCFPDAVWTWTGQEAPTYELNELEQVPYVEITPAPRTLGPPRSELHSAVPFQDRINTLVYNRLVAADFGAFRQITATGVALLRDETGAYHAPFDVGADRLLLSENPAASFGVIAEATLQGYLNSESADVQHLAAITQTPPHYLLGQIANLSASALKAAETGLVAKVSRRASHIGEGWERVMRLALGYLGKPGADDVAAETLWADFESRSEAETVDALVKMAALGVPRDVLWQKWGASPQDIERWSQLADEKGQIVEAPAPEPPPPPVPAAAPEPS
jgi:hypothetical protein